MTHSGIKLSLFGNANTGATFCSTANLPSTDTLLAVMGLASTEYDLPR